jgi:hypothetical protein
MPGVPLINEDLQAAAVAFYNAKHRYHTRGQKPFKASIGWVVYFKKRWDLTSRAPGKSHRASAPNPFDVALFTQRLINLMEKQNLDRVLNFDETRINVVPKVFYSINSSFY